MHEIKTKIKDVILKTTDKGRKSKFIQKGWGIGLILIAVIAFNFVFLPIAALAAPKDDSGLVDQAVTWVSGKIFLFASSLISAGLGALFGIILYLEAQIIDYILSPNNFSFTNSPIVTTGWGITRDLANMFFIFILLIIAFATVLKIQSYAIKQLWWKVLVAAILINFSLVIAGFVIDFSQVLTTFFIKQAIGGGGFLTITSRLASNMQILNFYNPAKPESLGQGITQFGASSFAAMIGPILTLIGLVITVFVFGAAAIFLIVRILYIWFLLIFAPFVWMLWILPATSGQFSKWWDNFIKWAFFAPVYVFMIYLSTTIFNENGKLNTGVFTTNPNSAWMTATPGLTSIGMPQAIFQWILVIAMMFGSLIVAKEFGVAGAAGARKILTGWGTDTKNWAGRQLRRQALGLGAREAGPGVEAKAGWLARGAKYLAGTAIPGRRLIAGQVFKMAAGEAATVEAAQKQFASWTPEAIQAYLQRSPGRITDALFRNQQIGAALALKDKGRLDTVDQARLRELAALASQQYPKQLDEILKVAPHLAEAFNRPLKVIVNKIEKAEEIMTQSLGYAQVAMNLNPQQLKTIAQKASENKIKVLKNTVDKTFGALSSTVQNTIQTEILSKTKEIIEDVETTDSEGKKTTTKTVRQIPISKDMRNNALRKLAEQDPDAEKIARAKFTTMSPAWEI